MKIPRKLKVGGFVYSILRDEKVSGHSDTYGTTHLGTQTINIAPDLNGAKTEATFLHEVLHAIWHTYGLKEAGFDRKQEEQIVEALSNGIYQVFKDNKLLK